MATPCSSFEVTSTLGAARTGTLTLTHGQVQTPAFMTVGTRGAIRGIEPHEVGEKGAGADIILSNTYHLWERPGHELIGRLGGLHEFMGWHGPILTDSGGYQVFSMRDRIKATEEGVRFRSPLNGDLKWLTPELAVEIQETLGVDVAMAFDECLEHPATRERAKHSTDRTTRWLKRCMAARQHADRTALFGIVQGGMYEDMRIAHAQEIAELDLDGYAIGGLSVGEGHDLMMAMVQATTPHMPAGKVRYLMGVGQPIDIVEAVIRGVDMFDCVLPTRAGRHGTVYTWQGKRNLKIGRYAEDTRVLDPELPNSPANRYSRAYLRYLFKTGELMGKRMATLHNLYFYQELMRQLRQIIASGDEQALQDLRRRARQASGPAPAGS